MNKPIGGPKHPHPHRMTQEEIKEEILRRLETDEADKANAVPWAAVRARLLKPAPDSD